MNTMDEWAREEQRAALKAEYMSRRAQTEQAQALTDSQGDDE